MTIARVVGSAASVQVPSAGSGTLACPVSPTSGNSIIVVVNSFKAAGAGAVTITKSAGTATIGTQVLDKFVSAVPGQGTQLRTEIIRVPVTGSGTLTLQATSTNTAITWGFAEYSGIDGTTPVDGSGNTSTGTSTTYSTGGVVTSAAGMVIGGYADNTASNPTYTPSDTLTWQQTNSANVTGLMQEKITTSSGTYTLTVTTGSRDWQGVGVAYLAAGGGGGGGRTFFMLPGLDGHSIAGPKQFNPSLG